MIEQWRAIPGVPDYEVSDLGRVRSWRGVGWGGGPRRTEPRVLKTEVRHRDGYVVITLRPKPGGPPRSAKIHHVVLEAFGFERPENAQVRHLNGIRHDNRLCNLCWGTVEENVADKYAHGTVPFGQNVPNARYTNDTVRTIRWMIACGVKQAVIARVFGITPQFVSAVKLGKIWNV